MRNKILAMLIPAGICVLCVGAAPRVMMHQSQQAQSQQTATDSKANMDQEIQMLRLDVRSKKKQLIASNLKLTDTEAAKFWPIYDQYTAELVEINNDKYALIKEYANNYGSMTDDQALDLTKRALAVDERVTQLRQKYVPIFNQVLPGTKTATFFQLDRQIQSMIDLQLASDLPLVQDQQ
jgi:hypothetical protein